MPNSLPFRRVAILGTGLIGGSFALALRKHFPGVSIVGFDRAGAANPALAHGAVDQIAPDLPSAIPGADLVYIALPIGAGLDALPLIASASEPHTLVTDACSTKAEICKVATGHFREGVRFLGGHPMAGKEHSGFQNADAELFRGAPYALIGAEDDPDPRVKAFAEILAAIGARPVWCDPETHDWAVGIVSHMPQLVSIALARVVQDETDETGLPVSLAGPGLQDTLRLAGSPYGVWRDILFSNTENISRALDRMCQAIEYLRTQLTTKGMEEEFANANAVYSSLRKPK